ncbi:transglycosylase domain-containing protein [Albibacterium sp.]|uniref:transglycosylase domain-containing protein n=1 Tax=Albibacterium sp. TaxID=2952885 RepID=UPI002C1ECED8|nr:transglycosylase domain-containing protein [Albibacterium sp.]HUH17624.1 transglycosylase domain-containing protein [Albibacterium sp.]
MKVQEKANREYQIDLNIDKAYFSGLSEVTLENVTVVPQKADQLASIQTLTVSVKIFPLLFGNTKIADLGLENAAITFIKKDSISNYDFIFRKKDSTETTVNNEPLNLANVADRMIHQILFKIPDNMKLRNFVVSYQDDSLKQSLTVPAADIDNGELTSTILVNQNQATWYLNGDLKPNRNDLFFQLVAKEKKVEFPLLEKKYGLKLNFDTLEAHLKKAKWNGSENFQISASGRIVNLLVNHWRIASNNVIVPNGSMDAEIIIGKDYIELDKNSLATLAKISAKPYAKLSLSPSKTIALGLEIPETKAQDVFDSFPVGLFESLEGLKVSGTMKYSSSFFLDTKNPDSVKLNSSLQENGFKINAYGKTDFSKINSQFVYTPYENGKPVRDIIVGPDNPNFTPLNQISPLLRNAVLTAEDPSFFRHQGFEERSIRASIATNFKEKAFKRGGSTISMQLVKNVFLDREKTIARKVEEMLIVWLIEHNKIVSKERMFEVYLNVIEWGRNVYGISEASRNYFLKKPSELDLGESIFLASIVPSPKNGIYRFNEYGGLKPYLASYFRLIGSLMANDGIIARDSTQSYGFYSVSLRDAVLPTHSVPDTINQDINREDLEREIKEAEQLLQDLFGTKLN